VNTSGKDLGNFDMYYVISDLVTNDQEAYYRVLSGFELKAGETKSLHMDNTGAQDHYGVNPNSLMVKGINQRVITGVHRTAAARAIVGALSRQNCSSRR
jgi:hypothetical protein